MTPAPSTPAFCEDCKQNSCICGILGALETQAKINSIAKSTPPPSLEEIAEKAGQAFFDEWKSNGACYNFGFFEFAHVKGYLAGYAKSSERVMELTGALELASDAIVALAATQKDEGLGLLGKIMAPDTLEKIQAALRKAAPGNVGEK